MLRLKSFNTPGHTVFSIGQINTYPLGIYAVQIITSMFLTPSSGIERIVMHIFSALCYAWWSDIVGARWPPMIFAGVGNFHFTYHVCRANGSP